MAAKKKSAAKRSSRKSNTTRKTAARKQATAPSFSWKSEVLLFVVLIFAIILAAANFGLGGSVGNAFSRFFFGLFGIISYGFPVELFLAVAFFVSNRLGRDKKGQAPFGRFVLKLSAVVLFFVFLCVFSHLVKFGSSTLSYKEIYAACSQQHAGGGLLGALLSFALIGGFGLVATYLIDFIVLILCIVLITEKSLFKGLFKGGAKVKNKAAEDAKKRRELSAAKRAEREAMAAEAELVSEEKVPRREHIVTGVSTDTAIKPVIHLPGEDATAEEIFPEEMPEAQAPKRTRKPKAEVQKEEVAATVAVEVPAAPTGKYVFPDINLLAKGDASKTGDSKQHLQQMSAKLQQTLDTFGVKARVTNVVCGPSVTQYEVQPEMGVKVSKVVGLANEIRMNLMVQDIRIEAPIPGKAAIGIEVPNKENVTVAFRDLIESKEFQKHPSKISFCAGKDIAGNVIVADIAKMPHLLIAGATGSGKSVCINTIIMSILYKADPEEVKLIMIDPKVVELSVYNNIPHLLIPVVTDPKKAAGALHWAVAEMTDRYNKFAEIGVRDMKGYNERIASLRDIPEEDRPKKMAQIVVIVDELADLMMVASGDVEDAICRLAQLARAAGIHLIIATQRPSVNVITGLIKANMPSRIAFSVTSGIDSRTILDMIGAENLLGKGDMLFYPQGYAKPLRVQGAFVSDAEVAAVVEDIIEKNGCGSYSTDIEDKVQTTGATLGAPLTMSTGDEGKDPYFADAARFLIDKERGSIGMLQRNFKIGFNRAARIMDQLEEAGIVGPEVGTKPREVKMDLETFESIKDQF